MRPQCQKCPWKVSTDPRTIPRGYSVAKHKALACTIARPGAVPSSKEVLHLMACHDTHELPCVGWLLNQLGDGNNLALRMAVMLGHVDARVQSVGPQHRSLEDTLPR